MTLPPCTPQDASELTRLNRMLIEDEKAENSMALPELERRMEGYLSADYAAFFVEENHRRVGYALVRTSATPLYLRQFFICREHRRKGYGQQAFRSLLERRQVNEIDLDVYAWNEGGMAFWKSLGFYERCHNMRFKQQPTQE